MNNVNKEDLRTVAEAIKEIRSVARGQFGEMIEEHEVDGAAYMSGYIAGINKVLNFIGYGDE